MDLELLLWILIFFGGYSLVVGYLVWVAMTKKGGPSGPPAG